MTGRVGPKRGSGKGALGGGRTVEIDYDRAGLPYVLAQILRARP